MFNVDYNFIEDDFKIPYDDKFIYMDATICGSFFIGKKECKTSRYNKNNHGNA
jgi:hypothetical protein